YYRETPYGLRTLGEQWAAETDKRLGARLPVPKAPKAFAADAAKVDDVRLLAYTQPKLVTGVPRKTPEIMELRVGGGDVAARIAFATEKLGKELTIADFTNVGQMIDVAAVTKGHGFKGPFQPRFIRAMKVPMPGQMGYHNRTEYNKRILKVGTDGAEITPAGGFLHYGVVRNNYILLHGSIPGPTKRLIRLREAAR